MNKRFIPIISFLMSVSLIIFVMLQINWLKEYYGAIDHEFSTKVKAAIESTIHRVQENEINNYLNKDFRNLRNTVKENNYKPSLTTIQQTEDSASKKIITYSKNIIQKENIPVSKQGDSLLKTKMFTEEGIIRIRRERTIPEILTTEVSKSIDNGDFIMREFVRLNATNLPIEKRVSKKNLNKILSEELEKKGILLRFSFCILNKNMEKTSVGTESFKEHEEHQKYNYPLFKDSRGNTLYTLSVIFPRKNYSLFKDNFIMLSGTILTLFVILGIYIISINYMMRQKKIAEIKTDFINNMSHELKTPIATISVATDALVNEKISSDKEKVHYYSQVIKQENLRMKKQVENILNMSKLERNKITLFLKEINVEEMIKKITESFSLIIKKRNGTLEFVSEAKRKSFGVDEFHLSNTMVNLLDNANKYSPEKPHIRIITKNEGDWFIVEISDQGIGISTENKNKVFEKFFREESGNIHNVKGQGLGLTYVKEITRLHGGKILVESEKKTGTTFILKLPMV
ncbi:MAG: HAMP domain-containing histidine kinase [Bergeyella sp.]|nr:HAMP domain-containing histidine kinase [Bergeyella sp.]